MIYGLLSVIIGIFIPLAIVYFQGNNKLSNYFFEFYLDLKLNFIQIILVSLSLITISFLDIFDIPSGRCQHS